MRTWAIATLFCVACGIRSPCADNARPGSIEAMVAHLNTLPQPIDAACILDSLARPLHVEVMDNSFSAQPSEGPRSPRIFLFEGDLSISVVPTGAGARVVEFGEFISATRTLKGELELPITETLEPIAPHDQIRSVEGGSRCKNCHEGEAEVEVTGGRGHTNVTLRPNDESIVDLELLATFADDCDAEVEPERCSVLHSLFAGDVVHEPFRADLPTIFDL